MKAIQFVESFNRADDARLAFAAIQEQSGYIGGRLLEPSPIYPDWRIQAFFEVDGHDLGDWLPDGCRVVIIPSGQQATLGIPRTNGGPQ